MITFLLLAFIAGCCLLVWTAWIEPRSFAVRRFDVQLANLKTPMTAVVIGDIQPNTYHWPAHRLRSAFSKLKEEEAPDLTLWLGDYYNGHTGASGDFLLRHPKIRAWVETKFVSMEDIADAMDRLHGRLGSFAVLGNHDWAWSGEETARQLQAKGITVLQDAVANVSDPESGQALQIVGYEDVASYRKPDYQKVHQALNPSAAQIALAHSPDTFPAALGGPALMLAGHTHGGQVRLPFIGALVLPLEYPQYDRGWFSERHRRLYVTTGLGTSLPPVRLLSRPEVIILNLQPADGQE